MTHQQIQDNEVIEQYVLQKLSPAERQAFQEHYFECNECFEQVNAASRFIAGVRESAKAGVLAPDQAQVVPFPARRAPALFTGNWATLALAACMLVSFCLVGVWALSLRRQNQLLVQQANSSAAAAERLQSLETKIRELEAGGSASQAEKDSLQQEVARLKEQLKATEQQRQTQLAELRRPESQSVPAFNVAVRNIYPLGGGERSGGSSDINRLNVPRATKTFVLILGDYKPGYSSYRLEIRDGSGRVVTTRAGLKPDQNGELSVLLNRMLLSGGTYRLKLYGQGQTVAEYIVQVD